MLIRYIAESSNRSWRTLLFTQIWMLLTWEYLGGINLVLPMSMCREKERKGIDEQGAEGPEEEGQARWGDMHVHGGMSPSPPVFCFLVLPSLIPFYSIC